MRLKIKIIFVPVTVFGAKKTVHKISSNIEILICVCTVTKNCFISNLRKRLISSKYLIEK